jgi:Major Facilitator Superfamily
LPPVRDLAVVFQRWTAVSAGLHRGYWLVTSLYLVIDANLTPFQLVFLGTAQGIISLLFEIPAGVIADTISRKASLVAYHVLLGGSMIATGLVTSFPALVVTQMIWGVAWTLRSGADVAWITDELAAPERIDRVLTAKARWEQVGAVVGMVAVASLAWLTSRHAAMILAGAAMVALGLYVISRFTERNFSPVTQQRWAAAIQTFRGGIRQARADQAILLILAATLLVNGAAEAFGRLYPSRLIEVDFPDSPNPIVWFSALGIAVYAVAAASLRIVEARIEHAGAARRVYVVACAAGVAGLALLAHAPGSGAAACGVLIVGGVGLSITRAISVVWVNQRVTSNVRATMHSFLAQVEYLGEITLGFALALVARATSITVAMTTAAALLAAAAALVSGRRRAG